MAKLTIISLDRPTGELPELVAAIMAKAGISQDAAEKALEAAGYSTQEAPAVDEPVVVDVAETPAQDETPAPADEPEPIQVVTFVDFPEDLVEVE